MKIKRLMNAVVAVAMVGINVFSGILPVIAADGDDPTIQNPDPVTLEDGVVLSKTVKSVPGYANKWEVTLRIESPKTEKTSDTVIVIDRSGSMGDDGRLTAAKSAANSLAQQLLPSDNTTNRVAVVSFASSASTGTDFTTDYGTVSRVVNSMRASGGTYTQSAIHMAADLLADSTADIKTMILLSDGEPTYSVAFTASARNNDDNFVAYGSELETSSEVDQTVFSYSDTGSVGSGGTLRSCIGRTVWGNCVSGKYYNHGNSAIAEAGYFKDSNNGTLYTIALDAGDVGTPILNAIASPGKHYTATPAELTRIFNDIGGSILSLIQEASVEDTMGHGVTISGTDGKTSLEWEPEFTLDADKGVFVAEKTYEVEMNEEVYNQTATGGFYALNESAVLTYNDGKTGEFPVPKAKPFDIDVEKELTVDGEKKIGGEFKFTISGNGTSNTYSVKSGEEHIIPVPMPIKIGEVYTVTEVGVSDDGEIPFEYYDAPEYSVKYNGVESATNKFVVTAEHGDVVDILIKNNYETTTVSASKTWDDDDDRDGLRSDYSDLYVAVKDGNKYVAYEALADEDKDYTFEGLHKNRNGEEISYTVVEAKGCAETNGNITCSSEFSGDINYAVMIADGEITNKHVPETTKLTIKKKWDTSAGTLPTSMPGFVTVAVSNDKNDTVETVRLEGTSYNNEWIGEFEGYKYEKGQEINYTVKEKDIAGSALNSNNILYVHKDGILEGKWTAAWSGAEITNTWTPAQNAYSGLGEFTIKKLDQDGNPLSGVTFEVNGEEHTTGSDGTAKIVFSESEAKPKDNYSFEIEETDAPENYALIEGTEVLDVATNIEITPVDEEMTNYYEKTFVFSETTPVKGYVWDGDELVLTATDQALIKGLKIVKSFEGLTAEGFAENSNISFVISGPDNYSETVGIDDDECGMSGGKLVCTISGLLPIGKYTVTEQNAGIDNFTYVSDPANGKISKTVKIGETAEFDFKNTYTSVNTASYKVAKVWEDDDDRDGIRPDDLEVTLYADGEAYGDPVKLTADEWAHEWTGLPLMNADVEEIEYTVTEASVSGYESDGGEMKNGVFIFTNTHVPATREITIKKTWDVSKGSLPTVNPTIITVELSNNGGDTQTVTLEGTDYGEWGSDAISVYVYVNQGETATYQVKETGIDDDNLDSASTLYIYNGNVLEGKWVAEENELTVKNTWTPAGAHYEYDGADEFEILKVDESGEKVLSGVVFDVNGETKTTDGSGKIKIEVPISDDEAKEEFEFTISEKVAAAGYELAEGSATVTVTCVSEWASASEEGMLNIYNKTCEFRGEGDNAFDWDGDEMILTVTNKRSKAASLAIEKTFSGVSEAELQGLTFTITGPEDFGDNGEMTLIFSDDCMVDGDVAICEVEGDVPTGEYTVKENNAELKNYTLTVTGDNETQNVEKDAEAVFEIVNEYKKIDPCADGEGCGGDVVPIVPPITPNTGSLTLNKSEVATGSVEANYAIGGAMVALVSVAMLVMGVRKEVKLTK